MAKTDLEIFIDTLSNIIIEIAERKAREEQKQQQEKQSA